MARHTTDFKQTGRLKNNLHPKAREIIYRFDRTVLQTEFEHIVNLNEAHILMLLKCELMDNESAKAILQATKILKKSNYEPLLDVPLVRGTYFAFESYLTNEAPHAGVNMHIARSRNDLLAASFLLGLRKQYFSFYKQLLELRGTLLAKAKQHIDSPLPIYSHYQTALPGTVAYYYLAIEEGLRAAAQGLLDCYRVIDTCPLGSAAGSGSLFDIDVKYLASLLGFSSVPDNALYAIANRDALIKFLSILNQVAITLSRYTEDLQLYSTQEFSLIEFDDNLCGCSSMMPQKKNPFILESIKGKLMAIPHLLATSSSIMSKVPFGNSVEVMFESTSTLSSATQKIHDAMNLLKIMTEGIQYKVENIHNAFYNSVVYATLICELLVKYYNLSFREAHHQIGEIIASAQDKVELFKALTNLVPNHQNLLREGPSSWVNFQQQNAGPSRESCQNKMTCWEENLSYEKSELERLLSAQAKAELKRASLIASVLDS